LGIYPTVGRLIAIGDLSVTLIALKLAGVIQKISFHTMFRIYNTTG
jgi:hypothetical protein